MSPEQGVHLGFWGMNVSFSGQTVLKVISKGAQWLCCKNWNTILQKRLAMAGMVI
jgi:hypothetical protein